MYKFSITSIVFLLISSMCFAQSQHGNTYYSSLTPKKDNIGLIVEIGINNNNLFREYLDGYSFSAVGDKKVYPKIGLFYQKYLSKRFSIRLSGSLIINPFSYSFAPEYDSLMENGFATVSSKFNKYESSKPSVSLIQPHIDFGYEFGPIRHKYAVELRVGAGVPVYLNKSSTEIEQKFSNTLGNKKQHLSYSVWVEDNYGKSKTWGTIVADVYIGVKFVNSFVFSDFLQRSSLGIQMTRSIVTSEAGYKRFISYTPDWDAYLGIQQYKFGLNTFGIRYAYNFIKL